MTDSNKAFRDYATRVSFNMTLSRNQIAQLRQILIEIEMDGQPWQVVKDAQHAIREPGPDHFIMGYKALRGMGLIEPDPRAVADDARCDAERAAGKHPIRKHWGPQLKLTPAGEHAVALLRIAGLIHPAAANANRPAKRKRA